MVIEDFFSKLFNYIHQCHQLAMQRNAKEILTYTKNTEPIPPFSWNYRLCVVASGSRTVVIWLFFTFIMTSFLHFGQNSGKFLNSVSSLIMTRVLLAHIGHNIHRCVCIVLAPKMYFSTKLPQNHTTRLQLLAATMLDSKNI